MSSAVSSDHFYIRHVIWITHRAVAPAPSPLAALLTRRVGAAVAVARRPLASYSRAAGLLASSTDADTGTPR